MVRVKRIYDPPEAGDGWRVLVDGLWPRGVKKTAAAVDAWLKELAPSAPLRHWFGHDPGRWEGFQARYARELEDTSPESLERLRDKACQGTVTLLFAARDPEHNNAVALKRYLESR